MMRKGTPFWVSKKKVFFIKKQVASGSSLTVYFKYLI